MGYRHRHDPSEEDKTFRAWLKENRALVEETGLPDFILQDWDHWGDFVDHGFLDHHDDPTAFTPDDLSARQKVALLELLRTWPNFLTSHLGLKVIGGVIEAFRQRYKG